jgi:hypothetical protein
MAHIIFGRLEYAGRGRQDAAIYLLQAMPGLSTALQQPRVMRIEASARQAVGRLGVSGLRDSQCLRPRLSAQLCSTGETVVDGAQQEGGF